MSMSNREIAERIARAGDYYKDYPSALNCSKCGQRLRATELNVGLLIERIEAGIAEAATAKAEWPPKGMEHVKVNPDGTFVLRSGDDPKILYTVEDSPQGGPDKDGTT